MGAQSILYFARYEDAKAGYQSCELIDEPLDILKDYRVAIDGHAWFHPPINKYKNLYPSDTGLAQWVVDIAHMRVVKLGSMGWKVLFVVDGFANHQKARSRDEEKARFIADIRQPVPRHTIARCPLCQGCVGSGPSKLPS